ncbi:protein PLASTID TRANSCRIPTIONALLY ACTIVE 7-like isoform X2 [Zingiber officinale]|uniref:protein PLASTID TRANSCRIPTIONALLY ACTIVE 7-like isoform X2 n=1 Tax=Zingiber officinale TaxID=94328 RepID=UPI001C4C3453|nr:protein PLASTID TRANSCRIPTIONALLY ACTIVE 7-like isoform X2 [Zingiber officinale]
MALSARHLIRCPPPPAISLRTERAPLVCSIRCVASRSQDSGEGGNRRRVWRRRRLTKNDDKLQYQTDRVPFLEEQVRKIRENGKIISMDIEKLLLREDNKFDFVNEVAAEATSYIEANRDEYGFKKPILHALSNRMKEAGFDRPEAYMETDPYKPDPSYLRDLEI